MAREARWPSVARCLCWVILAIAQDILELDGVHGASITALFSLCMLLWLAGRVLGFFVYRVKVVPLLTKRRIEYLPDIIRPIPCH